MGPALIAMAAYQVVEGMHTAQTIRDQAEVTKSINELNAKYAEQDQFNAEAYGATEVAAYQPTVAKTIAAQRTELAAHDVDLNYGTAADIQKETLLTGEFNMVEIQNQAHAKAQGFERQARNLRLQGALGQMGASSQASATESAGVASAASTGIKAYSRY